GYTLRPDLSGCIDKDGTGIAAQGTDHHVAAAAHRDRLAGLDKVTHAHIVFGLKRHAAACLQAGERDFSTGEKLGIAADFCYREPDIAPDVGPQVTACE